MLFYIFVNFPLAKDASCLVLFGSKMRPTIQDDFSESSEVSTYLEGVSSPETSHTNLTDLSRVPDVIVTQEFASPNFSSPHRKLAATFSAPPTFPTTYLASTGLVNQNNHAAASDSSSDSAGSTGSKKASELILS